MRAVMCARRNLKAFAIAAILGSVMLAPAAQAQQSSYPERTVTILVGVAAGGGSDTVARIVADGLSKQWGSPVVVENKAGGGGVIALNEAVKAAPDGYTILLASNGSTAVRYLIGQMDFDPRDKLDPVVMLDTGPYILSVNPSLPVGTLAEFIEYAKGQPGMLNYGSSGVGTPTHYGMELFQSMTGTDIEHIPYKGASVAVGDAVAGAIQVMLATSSTSSAQVKNGGLKPLAITGNARSPAFPDIPTFAEQGFPDFELNITHSLFVPKGTPREIVERINRDSIAIVQTPEAIKVLSNLGQDPYPAHSPEDLGKAVDKEFDVWGKFFQENPGIKAQMLQN